MTPLVPTEGEKAFARLLVAGLAPEMAAKTFEWRCRECDTTTYRPSPGGLLNHGRCEPHCRGEDLEIYTILAGEREFWCMAADLEGAKA